MAKDPSKRALAPWESPVAKNWLAMFDSWKQMRRLIQGTLQLEPKTHSHEVRAAASMVIMFCREDLWPTEDQQDIDDILGLASRQLSSVKHLYESKARIDPHLKGNPKYRSLMTTLDQEIRILEARSSEPKPQMPNNPPITWGEFWYKPTE